MLLKISVNAFVKSSAPASGFCKKRMDPTESLIAMLKMFMRIASALAFPRRARMPSLSSAMISPVIAVDDAVDVALNASLRASVVLALEVPVCTVVVFP